MCVCTYNAITYRSGTQKAHKHKHFIPISLPYWFLLKRGVIWDIPIRTFAYVLFWGPNKNLIKGLGLKASTHAHTCRRFLLWSLRLYREGARLRKCVLPRCLLACSFHMPRIPETAIHSTSSTKGRFDLKIKNSQGFLLDPKPLNPLSSQGGVYKNTWRTILAILPNREAA